VAKQPSVFHRTSAQSSTGFRAGDENGQTTAEYAVILTLVTAAVVLAVAALSSSISSHISDIASLF